MLDAFAQNFDERGEVGAAVCVYVDGQPVVDLWGGLADATHGTPWREDTLVLVYSSTKGVTAICANLLIERGLLDPDAPVATRVARVRGERQGRDHGRAGDVSIRPACRTSRASSRSSESLAWEPMVDALAAQTPIWEPGTKHGYHMRTFGWLVGELVRRADPQHRTIGTFWSATRSPTPLGVDFWIGLPPSAEPRVARLVPPKTDLREALAAFGDDLLLARVFSNPGGHFNYDDMWNTRAAARGRAAVVERHRQRARPRRGSTRRASARSTACARCNRDTVARPRRRARVRQGRGADDRDVLRARLHARDVVRRGQPAARVRARRRGRIARVRRPRHATRVRLRDERPALRHDGRSAQRGARARGLPRRSSAGS